MIVDATKYQGSSFRKGSIAGAVHESISAIKPGEKREFTGFVDGFGDVRDVRDIRTTLNFLVQKSKLSNQYTTRYRDGRLVVMRMADAG